MADVTLLARIDWSHRSAAIRASSVLGPDPNSDANSHSGYFPRDLVTRRGSSSTRQQLILLDRLGWGRSPCLTTFHSASPISNAADDSMTLLYARLALFESSTLAKAEDLITVQWLDRLGSNSRLRSNQMLHRRGECTCAFARPTETP